MGEAFYEKYKNKFVLKCTDIEVNENSAYEVMGFLAVLALFFWIYLQGRKIPKVKGVSGSSTADFGGGGGGFGGGDGGGGGE